MRTVNFEKNILFGIAALLGIDPAADLRNDHVSAWVQFANIRVKQGWEAWDFRDLLVTEERAFRPIWNASKRFFRSGTGGKPDEIFYIPSFAYFRVKATAPSDPPPGTLPTNTTYYEPLTVVDKYIDLDQPCRRAIGIIRGVYNANPRIGTGYDFTPLNYGPSERGIDVGVGAGMTAFIHYQTTPSEFASDPYEAARAYRKGEVVYWGTGQGGDGNCYRALAGTIGNRPDNAAYWAVVPVPAILASFLKLAVAADACDDLQTSGKLEAQAGEALTSEINKLLEQGERHFYRPWRRARRICGAPLGVGNFWWSVSPPYSSDAAITTLTDVCEDEGGLTMNPFNQTQGAATALISGQDYIDIVFATPITDPSGNLTAEWEFSMLSVESSDPAPLKIWPATVINKTGAGARVTFAPSGPDSPNYKLRWRVNAV